MLEKYSNKDSIMLVSGYNPYEIDDNFGDYDICLSKIFSVWGWATWKRAWKKYKNNIPQWHNLKGKRKKFDFMDMQTYRFYKMIFNDLQFQWYNSWGYQWKFAVWINDGYVITPRYNYIKNIGIYEENAEHIENLNKKDLFENVIKIDNGNDCSRIPNEITYNEKYDMEYQKKDKKKKDSIK